MGWPSIEASALDAATPAKHGKAIDHGGVTVGADQRVGVGPKGLRPRSVAPKLSETGIPN